MKSLIFSVIIILAIINGGCRNFMSNQTGSESTTSFPEELVRFVPYNQNPVFSGTGSNTWDKEIRERGFIIHEEGLYKMWYTGYSGGDSASKSLGYATSEDGISWSRYAGNPIFNRKWTEDIFVTKKDDTYYMLAEGQNDIAHYLTSSDGLNWEEHGDLIMLKANGDTIKGPYGTPTLWIENGKWYLFYEINDQAIWLASSTDMKTWKNIQDEPVLSRGPGVYDSGAVAANYVIRHKGKYYMYYHASTNPDWSNPNSISVWTSNVATSKDLIHWTKYPDNPIVDGDHSSPILVKEGDKFHLFTTHDKVWLYNPAK